MNRGTDLDLVLRIEEEETITLFTAKVEIGQGILTALAQIAAEELGVSMERMRVVSGDTAHALHGSHTVGSNSIQTEGNAVRRAASDARRILMDLAAERLSVTAEELLQEDGNLSGPKGKGSVSYWDLLGGKSFNRLTTGEGNPRPVGEYQIVGKPVNILNLLDKLTGQATFIQDLELPGMVHGRVVRPPGYSAKLDVIETEAVENLTGVIAVVRNGSFLGVVAEREEQAVAAAEALRESSEWSSKHPLPCLEDLYQDLLSKKDEAFLVVDGTPQEGPVPEIDIPGEADQTLGATYSRPYLMHAALGPSAAVAMVDLDRLDVWAHSQDVFSLRGALAQVLDMPEEMVRVRHVEGAGCYGHNGADDVALDAAILARSVKGRPVMLKWSRADEHGWEPYGPCMVVKMQASLSVDSVINWNHDVWSYTHSGRPRASEGTSGLLAARHLEDALPAPTPGRGRGSHGGIHRNADPIYEFPNRGWSNISCRTARSGCLPYGVLVLVPTCLPSSHLWMSLRLRQGKTR